MKRMLIFTILLVLSVFIMISCNDSTEEYESSYYDTLIPINEPANFRYDFDDRSLKWDILEGAEKYVVTYNEEEYTVDGSVDFLKIDYLYSNKNSFSIVAKTSKKGMRESKTVRISLDVDTYKDNNGILYCIMNKYACVIGFTYSDCSIKMLDYIPKDFSIKDEQEINDLPEDEKVAVKVIGNGAFYNYMNQPNIRQMIIPKTIEYIGKDAFGACNYLMIEISDAKPGNSEWEEFLKKWEKEIIVKEGNKDVVDVIMNRRACIGSSLYM